jgi:hypothetical protein
MVIIDKALIKVSKIAAIEEATQKQICLTNEIAEGPGPQGAVMVLAVEWCPRARAALRDG